MEFIDEFSINYKKLLESEYCCVDRFVLNGYFQLGVSYGGFREFWKRLYSNLDNLDDTHLIRMAGRFSRRLKGLCKNKNIPVVYCKPEDKKYELYKEYLPTNRNLTGLFLVFVTRAMAPIYKAKREKNGYVFLKKKLEFVNHYSFHIIDKDFGHMIIKMSGHPPFGSQIILNGHEWVERKARKEGLALIKEENCFTWCDNADRLCEIADTYAQAIGHLQRVCDFWIYQCLWCGLTQEEQKRTGFNYKYSIYQCEYSQNFCFKRGSMLDEVYQNLIDLSRRRLDFPTIKKILGKKQRPRYKKQKQSELKVSIEKPEYDLTVVKIQFGNIVIKLYDKGERTLRAEIMLLNSKDLKCKRSLENLPQIVELLKEIMTNFLNSLKYAHISFLNDGSYAKLLEPVVKGKNRLAGINMNSPRIRAFMKSALALSIKPKGFSIEDITNKMNENLISDKPGQEYSSRHTLYDIKKFKAKGIIKKIDGKRKFIVTEYGANLMNSVMVLFENIIPQTIAGCTKEQLDLDPKELCKRDICFKNINAEIKQLCALHGIQIAA
jgi:hypothetical protein